MPPSGEGAAVTVAKSAEKEKPASVSFQDLSYAELLKISMDLVHSGATQKDAKPILRTIRHFTLLRRKANAATLIKYMTSVLSSSPTLSVLVDAIKECPTKSEENEAMNDAGVDKKTDPCKGKETSSLDKDSGKVKDEKDKDVEEGLVKETPAPSQATYAESVVDQQVLLSILTLVFLIDHNYDKEKICSLSDEIADRVKKANRRYLDQLVAKGYYYHALVYERAGRLRSLRFELLKEYRSAVLHRDLMVQATLLNVMLRELMLSEDHEVAMRMVAKTAYPEGLTSNIQFARYLYYIGRLRALSLEYSEAHSKVMQSIRKAPQGPTAGRAFRIAAYKLAIVVELLMGDIPDRQIFDEKDMRVELAPYKAVVVAVRGGDLGAFEGVTQKYASLFHRDRTEFLIRRLHHNVIRAGLRTINLSYSKITLSDIAKKLGLGTGEEAVSDVEGIISKAILDGVMEATILHDQQAVQSKGSVDVYTSLEPTKAFHKRIAYCLNLHDDAVKAMQYVDDVKQPIQSADREVDIEKEGEDMDHDKMV